MRAMVGSLFGDGGRRRAAHMQLALPVLVYLAQVHTSPRRNRERRGGNCLNLSGNTLGRTCRIELVGAGPASFGSASLGITPASVTACRVRVAVATEGRKETSTFRGS